MKKGGKRANSWAQSGLTLPLACLPPSSPLPRCLSRAAKEQREPSPAVLPGAAAILRYLVRNGRLVQQITAGIFLGWQDDTETKAGLAAATGWPLNK